MNFDFDAELIGSKGETLPVYCQVQLPFVGGQKALIHVAVPAQHITENPPSSPCSLSGKIGAFAVNMRGVYWRRFPTSSKSTFGLEAVELLHVEALTIRQPASHARKEIRFHIAPIDYLRSESGLVRFSNSAHAEELFVVDLPGLGAVRFVLEWVTIYHRDSEIPGATVNAGFNAVASLPPHRPVDIDKIVADFKKSLDTLSVLFRQAVSLHGWTYTDGDTVATWITPLRPNVTPSAREERGDFVAKPQVFVECATNLVHSYQNADEKTRSLVRHLSLAINPHNDLRDGDHFLLMFSALERVIESAWKRDKTPNSPAVTTSAVIKHLEELRDAVAAKGDVDASVIAARLGGLINVVNRPSIQDKLKAFLRVYPAMDFYCRDLWPILGSEKERGLREIRHALAHGSGSFISLDVVAVAKWHLAILLERMIFVLLAMPLPDGILPRSYLLQIGGKGWYERDWWEPLRCKPNQPI
jgi:hypothetical protein